jgi:hypothetical protein
MGIKRRRSLRRFQKYKLPLGSKKFFLPNMALWVPIKRRRILQVFQKYKVTLMAKCIITQGPHVCTVENSK